MTSRNHPIFTRRFDIIASSIVMFAFLLGYIFLPTPTPDGAPNSTVQSTTTGSNGITVVPKPDITIVAFGDSVTAGYGITVPEAYPKQLEDLLRARGLNVSVINSGVSGETTAGGLRRAQFVAEQNPDIVLLALGGNDVLRGIPPENTKANLAQTITIFQKAGIRVVLVGMYAPANLGDAYVGEFNALYPELARTYQIPLVPFLLHGVALNPALNQNDGIHPNQEGARIIAEQNILPVLLSSLFL